MNARNLIKAFLLLALMGMTWVPVVRADEREAQTIAHPPLTLERRGALESAATNSTLPLWQREIMSDIAGGATSGGMGASSHDADVFSPQRMAGAGSDVEWVGIPVGQRVYHSAIYDPVRDRMVVFGGGSGSVFKDVCELALTGTPAWSVITPSGTPPPARYGHTAFYDPVRDRMVVFGGNDGSSHRNDVWELTLSGSPAWSALNPSGTLPPGRSYHSAIYDSVRDRMLVFGGHDGSNLRNDLWALTLSGSPVWSALIPSGSTPQQRYLHTAIHDPVRDRMIVRVPINVQWRVPGGDHHAGGAVPDPNEHPRRIPEHESGRASLGQGELWTLSEKKLAA